MWRCTPTVAAIAYVAAERDRIAGLNGCLVEGERRMEARIVHAVGNLTEDPEPALQDWHERLAKPRPIHDGRNDDAAAHRVEHEQLELRIDGSDESGCESA